MLRSVRLVVAVLSMCACASAQLTAFRDPAYATRRFGKLVVFALGMRLDARVKVEHAICEKVAPTPCGAGVGGDLVPSSLTFSASAVSIELDNFLTGRLTNY